MTIRITSLFIIIFLTVSFSNILNAEQSKGEVLRLPKISLELKLENTKAVRGESIPFRAVITNNGDSGHEIEEVTKTNESLIFYLQKGNEKATKSSFFVPYGKTGGVKPETKVSQLITINPKQSRIYSGDLLNLFGNIKTGTYSFYAIYNSKGLEVKSKPVSVKINRANLIYAFSQWEYDKIAQSNLKTVWINKAQKYDVYFMENNAKNPEVIEYSKRVWQSHVQIGGIKISAINDFMQNIVHLIWKQGASIYALMLNEAEPQGNPKKIPTGLQNYQILEPSFTDKEGNLFLFLTTVRMKGNTSFYVLKVPKKGERATKKRIAEIPGTMTKSGKYSLLVDSSSKLNVAINMGSQIFYFVYDLIGSQLTQEVKAIKGITDSVQDISILQRFAPEKGSKVSSIYYLTKMRKEKDAYTAYLYEFGAEKPSWYPKMHIYYPERLRIIQSVLDTEMRPYYLLNVGKRIFFQPYHSGDLRQILPPEDNSNMLCTFPQIILSSSQGNKYGVYVRYIENKSHITYKFLKEIAD